MPIGECCADGDCGVSPHAVTGWCLAATGAPVLVLTTLACPEGFTGPGVVTTTLIDPLTGAVIPAQAIVACGDKDWEVNQLCDYDPVTGDLIATFIQIFEWDEDTGVLIISLVRADNPAIPYVPVGTVRSCTDDETHTDVEVTELCYNDGGLQRGFQAWVFLNGVHISNLYFDAFGNPLVLPAIVDCPPPATEETLGEVLVVLQDIDTNTDGLEACCAASNVLLTAINANTDGLEACCAASNVLLTLISGNVVDIEALLTTISGSVDGLEACCAAGNVLLTAIASHVDGLEACCAASNVLLTTIAGHVDGIEGFLATLVTIVRAEDTAHVSGDFGVPAWAVRNDSDALVTSANGDYSQISVDEYGRVKTRDVKAEDDPHVSADLGSFVLGVRNDGAVVLTSANGDYSPLAVDSAGRVGISDLGGSITVDGSLSISPVATGGTSVYKNLDSNATGVNIKASAGRLHSIVVANRANAERFLKFYNKASAPIVGTDIPVMTIFLDGKTGGGQTGLTIDFSVGIEFTLGIGVATTTGIADTDVGNPGANNVVLTVAYA